jgi:hypothetical protein
MVVCEDELADRGGDGGFQSLSEGGRGFGRDRRIDYDCEPWQFYGPDVPFAFSTGVGVHALTDLGGFHFCSAHSINSTPLKKVAGEGGKPYRARKRSYRIGDFHASEGKIRHIYCQSWNHQ